MNKISIRAVPKQFQNGSFLLLPATPSDRKVMDSFAQGIGNKYVRITLSEIKPNHTYDQVRTVWGLIEALYEIENHAKPTTRQSALAYAHLIELYAPKVDDPLDPSRKMSLTLSQMSKYEASVFINSIMNECMEKMGMSPDKSLIVEVQDLFTEFIDWRGRQKRDPIDVDENGEWLTIDEWVKKNPASMASGSTETVQCCHIITKNHRPDLRECVWNLLRMTHYEHIEIQHRHGWERLLSLYPHLIPRVRAAYDRAGELYPFTVRDKFDKDGSEANEDLTAENGTDGTSTKSLASQALGSQDYDIY